MSRQLKRWESPRREGRNDKGRGGSARKRQRQKQFQVLRQKLKEQSTDSHSNQPKDGSNQKQKGKQKCFPFCLGFETLTRPFPAGNRRFQVGA